MKPIAIILCCFTLAFLGPISIDTASAADDSDKDQIAAIREQSNQAIARHDVAGIVRFLDSEYQITTGRGLMYHHDPEQEGVSWAEHFARYDDVVYTRTPQTIEISSYLPRAAESGRWLGTWTNENGQIEVSGSYTASWRKVDGDWKIQSEIFVSLFCKGVDC